MTADEILEPAGPLCYTTAFNALCSENSGCRGHHENETYFLSKTDVVPTTCLLGQNQGRIVDPEAIWGSCDLIRESYFPFK